MSRAWPAADDEAIVRLLVDFWRQVRADLAAGDVGTRAWLESPQFVHWASVSTARDPETIRAALLACWPADSQNVTPVGENQTPKKAACA